MVGGSYKQEQTHGGYQDVLKIRNHSSQRIEETNNWYERTTGSFMKTVGSLRVLKYPVGVLVHSDSVRNRNIWFSGSVTGTGGSLRHPNNRTTLVTV